jgi:hypothetical protein
VSAALSFYFVARWPGRWRLAAVGGVAAFGLMDQLPRPPERKKREQIAAEVRSVLRLGRKLEGGDEAVLSYFNPYRVPLAADVRLELVGVSPRDVEVRLGRRAVGTARVASEPITLHLKKLELLPGINVFRLKSSEPATRRGRGRGQLRAMGLKEASIHIVSPLPVE